MRNLAIQIFSEQRRMLDSESQLTFDHVACHLVRAVVVSTTKSDSARREKTYPSGSDIWVADQGLGRSKSTRSRLKRIKKEKKRQYN